LRQVDPSEDGAATALSCKKINDGARERTLGGCPKFSKETPGTARHKHGIGDVRLSTRGERVDLI
jgi:hypothetical protein